MEKEEKALLEELKNFDIINLYQKGSYIDFNFQNYWTQGYILGVHPNNKFDISYLYHPSDTKDLPEINSKYLGFFGEYSYKNDFGFRNVLFNRELDSVNIKQIYQKFKLKLKKSNLEIIYENKEKKKPKNKEKEKNNKQKEIKNDIDNIKREQKYNKDIKQNNEEKEIEKN